MAMNKPYGRSDLCISRVSRPAGTQSVDGSYEIALLKKPGHPPLDRNKNGIKVRLNNLIIKFQKQPKRFEQFDLIIQTQLSEGIIDKATKGIKGILPSLLTNCERRSRA